MTPKEKAYIIGILAEARADEKCRIIEYYPPQTRSLPSGKTNTA